MNTYLIIFLVYLFLVSTISFFLYGGDKNKAEKKVWRTKEKVLLSFGFFGGAIGAIVGMKVFHHKTKHWYFWVVNVLGLLWQIAVAVLLYIHF